MVEKPLHKKTISELKKYIVGFTRFNTLDGTLKSVPDISIDFRELKQCAIAIVKEIRAEGYRCECEKEIEKNFKTGVTECNCDDTLEKFLIYFFELTEEDLK